jgi:hypothetical protein
MSVPFPLLLRFEFPPPRELDLLRLWGPRFAALPLERELEREALLRPLVDAEDFEFDEPVLLCPLREVELLLAIPHPSPIENVLFLARLPAS